MDQELISLTEFLTGGRTASSLVPWRLLRAADLRVIRAWAAETRPPAAQQRLIGSLRRVLIEAWRVDPEAAKDPEPPLASLALPRGRPARHIVRRSIATREVRALLTTCDDHKIEGLRDGAIIALMLLAGLRRREVVSLHRSDYDPDGACLRVRSRGAPTRLVALEGESREALEAWLRASEEGSIPMFIAIRGGEALSRGLTLSAVNRLLSRRCHEASCSRLTPRDLRSHFLRRLQAASRLSVSPPCRFQQTEDGEACWVLSSLPAV